MKESRNILRERAVKNALVNSDQTAQYKTKYLLFRVVKQIYAIEQKWVKEVVKASSFNQLAYDLDRNLSITRLSTVPTQKTLIPQKTEHKPIEVEAVTETPYVDVYLQLIEQKEREEELLKAVEDAYQLMDFSDIEREM